MLKDKILITGAAGFIGHTLPKSLTLGYKVVAFDRYNISNDFNWLNELKKIKKL